MPSYVRWNTFTMGSELSKQPIWLSSLLLCRIFIKVDFFFCFITAHPNPLQPQSNEAIEQQMMPFPVFTVCFLFTEGRHYQPFSVIRRATLCHVMLRRSDELRSVSVSRDLKSLRRRVAVFSPLVNNLRSVHPTSSAFFHAFWMSNSWRFVEEANEVKRFPPCAI